MKKFCILIFSFALLAAAPHRGFGQEAGGRAELDKAYGKGVALRKEGKHAEAIPFLEKAVALAPKVHGPDDLKTANVLYALGNSYRLVGRSRETAPLYRRVLEIREARLGKDDPKVASAWNGLGAVYRDLTRHKEAEAAYRRSLQIYEAKLPANHPDLASPLNNLGVLLLDLARHDEAEPLLKRSLQIRVANQQADDTGAALAANSLGSLYRRQHRFADAEIYLRRSLAIYEAKRGPESLDVANLLNSLAVLSKDLAKYQEAEKLHLRSLTIKESKLGKDHPAVALSLSNLAILHMETGRFREAESLFQRSLKIMETRSGKDSMDAALVLTNLAGLYQEMGRLEEAKALLTRGLEIHEIKLPKNHPVIANDWGNLGNLYNRLGQRDKAEEFLRRSLQMIEARGDKDGLAVCSPLNNLARIFQESNRFQDAYPLFRRGLHISEATLGKDHPNLIAYLNNLAQTAWCLKRFQDAEDYSQRSLRIAEAKFGKDHPHRATILSRLAWIHHGRKAGEPLQEQAESFEVLRTHLQDAFAFGSESAMLNHLDNIKGALPSMIELAIHSDRPGPAATLAYDWTLHFKGLALDTLCRYRQAQHLVAPDDALAQRVARYRTLKQLQASAVLTPPTGLKPEQIKEQMAKWRTETEEVEAELNSTFARRYPNPAGNTPLTIAAVQQKLPADAALIEFVRVLVVDFKTLRWNGFHYRAFVVNPGQAPQLIELGPAKAIDDDVRRVRQHIIDFQEKLRECESPAEARTLERDQEKLFHEVSAKLHARLLAPLRQAIGPAKLLYIAADGELNRLPFEALVDAEGKYLVESKRCAYLSSGRDLLRAPAKAAEGTLVLAGPDFKADAEQRLAQVDKLLGKSNPVATALRGSAPLQLRSKGWGPLPGAAAEAKDIHGLLHDSAFGPVKTYTGAAALEEVLKAAAAPRVLHLATHGFFLDREPAAPDGEEAGTGAGWARSRLKQADNPLLRSGIVLAGANTVGDQDNARLEDGWVTAEEIALLNLQSTELVVLSACQTGLGDIKTGEGVYGLRRAFLYAGARTLVTSLFEVPDAETRTLMNRFYGGLKKGQGKLDSLHAAQVEMLRGRRASQEAVHPFFWASFVLVGDPN